MNIGLIAHDAKKKLMQNFCVAYRGILCKHELYATGTTGRLIEEVTNLTIHKYLAGHLGGQQQMGAQIENNEIDFVDDEYFATLISNHVETNYLDYQGDDITLETNTYKKDNTTYYLVETPIRFNVKRDGEKVEISGYVNVVYDKNGEYVGWTLGTEYEENDAEFALDTYKYGFFEALGETIPFTCKWAWKVLVIFGQLLTGQLSITSLGGPVTTVKMIANFTQQNMLLLLLPLIAVNLAVFNLLPIPALDGFQMIFVAIEWIRKKPVKQEIINVINYALKIHE